MVWSSLHTASIIPLRLHCTQVHPAAADDGDDDDDDDDDNDDDGYSAVSIVPLILQFTQVDPAAGAHFEHGGR